MDRTLKLALLSLLYNAAFSTYHIVFGIMTVSWWLLTVGIYYAILSIIRFVVLQTRKHTNVLPKVTGIMLMFLSLSLVGTVILSAIEERGIVFHEIVMIGIAAYTFTKLTFATIQWIKARKSASEKLIPLRNISFADAFVSIFSLQRSMLVSFAGMSVTEISMMNIATGSAVSVIVFLLGLNLVQNRKILFSSFKHPHQS